MSEQLPSFLSEPFSVPPALSQAVEGANDQHSTTNISEAITMMNMEAHPISGNHPCRCTPIALEIYEKLMLSSYAKNSEAFGSINEALYFLKIAAAHGMSMMDCPSCSNSSSLVTLVASVCEKLIFQFENVISLYLTRRTPRGLATSTHLITSPEGSPRIMSGMSLRLGNDNVASISSVRTNGYVDKNPAELKIDSDDEVKVIRVLLMSRMNFVDRLLQRMLSAVNRNGHSWDGHRRILEGIGAKLRAVANRIR